MERQFLSLHDEAPSKDKEGANEKVMEDVGSGGLIF